MKKNILFVSALKLELDVIKEQTLQYSEKDFCFKFLLTGVGNYNVIYTLQDYLTKNEIDFVVNIWVCGVKKETNKKLFQVYRIKNLANEKEALVPIYFQLGELISLGSSEKILTNQENTWEEFVDMESFWIDFVCSKKKIPYIILKIPFDTISESSKKVNISELRQTMQSFDVSQLISELQKFFSFLPMEKSFEKYKKHFSLTFAETEILKRNYYKFQAFHIDFEAFFEKNKAKTKKEFLQLMENTKDE